ncbi:unnamed protein product [Linum tenue]|uniref:Uncharacterized protein n=1 Tax=Linum tenue TaxID=586396 RepID=A0AAV0QV92_9ROSI|nr:unnamed protein product [Linum tenue]
MSVLISFDMYDDGNRNTRYTTNAPEWMIEASSLVGGQ